MGALSAVGQSRELSTTGSHHVVLSSTERSLIKRIYLPDGDTTVIWKEFRGPAGPARRRREHAILLRLGGLPGVSRLADWTHPDAELLADEAGRTLAYAVAAREIDLAAVPRLGHRLARIIAGIHARGIVHKDINPANILIAALGRPVVVDFDSCSLFTEDQAAFGNLREIEGTLQYLPPEQTGRTGLPVDHRADLYALGATLYEVVAGHPPLAHDDDLQHLRDLLLRVPVPLAEVRPETPPTLSAIIARLLEKEPDRRYQSAEGLAHDLSRLCENPEAVFPLGERDFPLRLTAPSGLIGRETEVTALRTAWEEAVLGGERGIMITGGPGTGKSALMNALRRPVAARGGYFVIGRADPAGQGATAGPVLQALRRLGSLLLAEPRDSLAALRTSLLAALGPNTGLIAAALPEFATLLRGDDRDDISEAGGVDTRVRLQRAVVTLLRVVAGPRHPVLLAVDDLQWADPTSIDLLDAVLSEPDLPSVLVVGACRPDEDDDEHPPAPTRDHRRRRGAPTRVLHLGDLSPEGSRDLVREVLRLPAAGAAELAGLLHGWTGGNPSDTLELVNALRRGGALTLGDDGWHWDEEEIRRQAARCDVVGLLRDRIDHLEAETRWILRLIALLPVEVPSTIIARAAGLPLADLLAPVFPAMEEELVVAAAAEGNRAAPIKPLLRNDRVRQAVLAGLPDDERRRMQLDMARNLSAQPDTAILAAEQYLEVAGLVTDDVERRTMAGLFLGAAGYAAVAGNHRSAESFAGAAAGVLDPAVDEAALVEALGRRHAALYQLGRLDEADAVYAAVARADADPVRLSTVAVVQVSSLAQRSRQHEAIALACDLVTRLGYELPGPEFDQRIPGHCRDIQVWSERLDPAFDLARPEITDPRVLAAGRLFSKLMPMCFLLGERLLGTWVLVQTWRMWQRYGPSGQLAATLTTVGMLLLQRTGDYQAGVRIGRHLLTICERRDYEPFTSLARYRYAMQLQVWADPIEETVGELRRAHEGLVRGGELDMAAGAWNAVLVGRLESAPTVQSYQLDIEAALDFDARTGNAFYAAVAVAHRQLARALQGRTAPPGSLNDADFTEAGHLAGMPPDALAASAYHVCRALAAAVFGDDHALQRHATAAGRAITMLPGYLAAQAQVLSALADVTRLHTVPLEERTADPAFAAVTDALAWFQARAAECPASFGHLAHWFTAEAAWVRGALPVAFVSFDLAVRDAQTQERPWHAGLILERAAKMYHSVGLTAGARLHLAEAIRVYGEWGATAKVEQLCTAHPRLRPPEVSARSRSKGTGALRSDAVDTMAIVRASQALSSATDLGLLRKAIDEQLTAITGASEVVLVIRGRDNEWFLPGGPHGAEEIDLEAAEMYGMVPVSAFQYAVRTRDLVLVEDATRDDRFARDPYLNGARSCSLLVVPVVHGDTLPAVLVLANRQTSGLFTADRLDAVRLITGQLVVSLNNALLYVSLEARVAERTRELATLAARLEELSSTDALTGLANRRRFEQGLSAHHDRLRHSGLPFAVLMIDVDFFKKYNDRFGHQAGDECLRKVGAALSGAIRAGTDLACRYGGEEFVLILGDTDPVLAATLAERTRSALQSLRIPHPDGPAGVVTASIGVAVASSDRESTTELIRRADAALYRAKAAGRNGVMVAEPLDAVPAE